MSLDNIQLPPIVLQDLYRNSLIDLKTVNTVPGAAASPTLAYLGNNQKHVVIIVDEPEAIYLPDEELNFLLGILTACKLSMADIALLNYHKNPAITYKDIAEQLQAEKIFLFGTTPAILELPLQFPHYQVQQYNDQVYLSSPNLKKLRDDKAEKTKLWNCLKQVFSIG